MNKPLTVLSLLCLAAMASPAQSAEVYKVYDDFTSGLVDPDRWNQIELVRRQRDGQLVLRQRSLGTQTANTGSQDTNHSMSLDEPARITQLGANITVTEWAATGCTANSTPTEGRARLIGSFFNQGVSTPGSQVNDVLAQVRVYRRTNASTPAGTLTVEGLALVCTNSDCSTSTLLGGVQDLGTTMVGSSIKVTMAWDQANKQFQFARDGGSPLIVAYALADTTPPSVPLKSLQTRTQMANCFSGPRTEATVEASFDNVVVNASGVP